MDEFRNKIEEIYKEIDPLKLKLSELAKTREGFFSQREEIRRLFDSKLEELRVLKRKRDELNRAVREKKDQRQKLTVKIRELIEALNKAKTVKETEKRSSDKDPHFMQKQLKRLEQRVETEALSPDAEKKLMKQVK